MKFLLEDIQLNPILWDENNNLKEEVKNKLLQIKDKFILGLQENDIPAAVVDVRIVGSNANYNYNQNSDIDLHIVVDMDGFNDEEKQMLNLIYSYYKSSFNDKYDIKIKNTPVELYIEDKNTCAISNGIYSVQNNEWIKKPTFAEKQEVDISKPLDYMIRRFEEVKLLEDPITAETFLDLLYANRQRSLAVEGEYGIDNLIFKEFRNRGFIQEIKDIIKNGESKEMSLEGLSELYHNKVGK